MIIGQIPGSPRRPARHDVLVPGRIHGPARSSGSSNHSGSGAAAEGSGTAGAAADVTPGTAAPVLLIAEDDDDVLAEATQLLSDAGFRVHGAIHGGKLIELLEGGLVPSVIVLDLVMPIVSGWDVWDWLKQSRYADIPIIIWTATGLRQGAVGNARVIGKGSPADLIAAVRAATGGSVA